MIPPSNEIVKQAREDYQTTRDAIVDEVNELIGRVEQDAHNALVELNAEMLRSHSELRRKFTGGLISVVDFRERQEAMRELANMRRGQIIEARMGRLGEIDRRGRESLDGAKTVYRTIVGDRATA